MIVTLHLGVDLFRLDLAIHTPDDVGLVSFVPGGLGVFEVVMLLLLPTELTHPQIIGSLVSFRVIYYLIHLAIVAAILGTHELLQLGKRV
jgi:uncharacterized membrane protein YbhN (UPF0104 family)